MEEFFKYMNLATTLYESQTHNTRSLEGELTSPTQNITYAKKQ